MFNDILNYRERFIKKFSYNILRKNIEILKIIMDKIDAKDDINWVIAGNMSLALQGVEVDVNDIDIISDRCGAEKLNKLLSEFCIKPLKYSFTENYRSFYGIYKINNIKVEIMGNFQYKLKSGRWSIPNQLSYIEIYNFKNMQIPVLTLTQELKEYENIGKFDKVVAIKKQFEIKI
ncbi:MAG: hypothetical protein RsTaC01_0304 [Candidatus Paraimprobicoccus trichonymphae]|uniref:Uncharacterized protein n=1 Tax=Candidatus Paraimprobicoccus trichonymphae TaxID=3033793 RepID=A0AA48KZ50_9FIRM|nr:MAG: hypothetical protein RsTaC01_0304 [Candidatus Paraimprobicoccus trichonymphae]